MRIHTAKYSELLGSVVIWCEICKAPTSTEGRQPAANGRISTDDSSRSWKRPQFQAPGSAKRGSKRWRGSNARSPTSGRSIKGSISRGPQTGKVSPAWIDGELARRSSNNSVDDGKRSLFSDSKLEIQKADSQVGNATYQIMPLIMRFIVADVATDLRIE